MFFYDGYRNLARYYIKSGLLIKKLYSVAQKDRFDMIKSVCDNYNPGNNCVLYVMQYILYVFRNIMYMLCSIVMQ